jgi:glycine dehydrogenase subunit 2
MTVLTTVPTVYEASAPGRVGVRMPEPDVPRAALPPAELLRDDVPLPELSQLDVVRHFVRLSQLNYAIDTTMVPLGSCTMKYNPKVNEDVARLPGFAGTHPLQDEDSVQGNLYLLYHLQEWLKEIAGFAAISLQPAAGAQGEFSGILMMRKYHLSRGDTQRTKMLIPDSAHGTNPASSAMAGLRVVEIRSDARGNVDLEALRAQCDETVVGMMITNPTTLGLFEENLEAIAELVHGCGGLMYGDGANMNALLGVARPGDLGFDVMHYNLHKTFSTPHGGGGPGAGPVACSAALADFLPGPIVALDREQSGEEGDVFRFVMPPQSIGRMKAFHGNFGMFTRAYTYIRVHGAAGLFDIARHAVLNANYLRVRLEGAYPQPYAGRTCMHEFVAEGRVAGSDIHALDISKRLMDYGYHPSTNYFPLIVPEALMIEPTESESRETLDDFIQALQRIAEEARTDPALLHDAPHSTPVRRLDEVRAAKELVLCCKPIAADLVPLPEHVSGDES